MQHTEDDNSNGKAEGDLMGANFTGSQKLYKYQWVQMQNPPSVWGVFESGDDGELANDIPPTFEGAAPEQAVISLLTPFTQLNFKSAIIFAHDYPEKWQQAGKYRVMQYDAGVADKTLYYYGDVYGNGWEYFKVIEKANTKNKAWVVLKDELSFPTSFSYNIGKDSNGWRNYTPEKGVTAGDAVATGAAEFVFQMAAATVGVGAAGAKKSVDCAIGFGADLAVQYAIFYALAKKNNESTADDALWAKMSLSSAVGSCAGNVISNCGAKCQAALTGITGFVEDIATQAETKSLAKINYIQALKSGAFQATVGALVAGGIKYTASRFGKSQTEIQEALEELGEDLPGVNLVYKSIPYEDFAKTFTASDEQYKKAYQLWGEDKWDELYQYFKVNDLNNWNGINWPPFNGAKSIIKTEKGNQLAGKVFDRFQGDEQLSGGFASPVLSSSEGVNDLVFTYDSRALANQIQDGTHYIKFKLKDNLPLDLEFEYGEAIPWFNLPGTADQIRTNIKFQDLSKSEYEVLEILRYDGIDKKWIKIK